MTDGRHRDDGIGAVPHGLALGRCWLSPAQRGWLTGNYSTVVPNTWDRTAARCVMPRLVAQARHDDHHPRHRPDRERGRRAPVHQLLPPDGLIRALGEAYEAEQSPAAKDAIAQILTNSRMCAEGHRPICQDTGIVTVFVKWGQDCRLSGDRSLQEVVDEGVRRAYLHPRTSCAPRSWRTRPSRAANTRDNTPSVLLVEMVPGNTVSVDVAAKGGGLGKQVQVQDDEPQRLDRRLGAGDDPANGRRLVPAGDAGHRHRRHRGEGDAARQGIADGRDRHGHGHCARAAPATISRRCASRSWTRSTRWASARRGWAACRPSST